LPWQIASLLVKNSKCQKDHYSHIILVVLEAIQLGFQIQRPMLMQALVNLKKPRVEFMQSDIIGDPGTVNQLKTITLELEIR
jgi:hypothetical protein